MPLEGVCFVMAGSLTFAELKDVADSPELVRKSLQGVAFMAPMTETPPAALLDTDGKLLPFGAQWWPVGIVNTDGYKFSSNINKVETEAWGYSVPIRTDIDKAPKQVVMTPLEMIRRRLQELSLGVDLSAIAANANGEVVFEEPDLPSDEQRRLVVIYFDGTPSKPFYRGKCFSAVKRAGVGDETWSGADSAVGQELTLDVQIGPEGWPVRHYMGGGAFDAVAYGYGSAPAWAATTAYTVGNQVTLTTGERLKCTTGGTSGSSEPTAPASIGGTVTDGTVTWTRQA